jgi:hypothetical protein
MYHRPDQQGAHRRWGGEVEGRKAIADRTMCPRLRWLWGLRIIPCRRRLMAGRLERFSKTKGRTGCLGYGVPGQQHRIKCHAGKSNRSSRAAILMQPTQAHVSSLVFLSTSIQGAIRRRSVNQPHLDGPHSSARGNGQALKQEARRSRRTVACHALARLGQRA